MMAALGLELDPDEEQRTRRRKWRLILRALLFDFVVLPGLALGVARALGATGPLATGLLLLAASPGGRFAPMLVKWARGDTGLSVEMTLFACKLSSFVSPLLAVWMIRAHKVSLHELTFVLEILLIQMVPYLGARQLRKRRPAWAAWLVRPLQRAAAAAALILVGYLVAHETLRSALMFGVRDVLVVLAFGVIALGLGWLGGGRERRVRRSFGIGIESRNLALALVIGDLAVGDFQLLLATFGAWLILLLLGAGAAALARGSDAPVTALPRMPASPA
jgi:BASS family bile acid:Na+ symporter